MFKRLRERIAEEANARLTGGENAFGNSPGRFSDNHGKAPESNEDLIVLGDSSAVIEPLPISQQFSIAEDEDASFSDPNSPQKKANSSAGSELSAIGNKNVVESNNVQTSTPRTSYIPQTDIESEVEEPPTLNLDGISKEQLMSTIELAKAKLCKYKNKYAEVVKAYKHMNEEKKKLEHTLTENQDKSLRRIAELREQCQLEQKAKAHLEENLRLLLEEKESRISVLETQVNLLKEGHTENSEDPGVIPEQNSGLPTVVATTDSALREKVEKLHHLLNECKGTILAKTEKISELMKEKEVLCQKIVTQSKASEEFEETKAKILVEHEEIVENLTKRLTELERQQEDSVMAMAETKRNMHEELELKERQLVKMKEEIRQLQLSVDHKKTLNLELRKQHEEKVKELNHQLENTEKLVEEGKKGLVQEISHGTAEAEERLKQTVQQKDSELVDVRKELEKMSSHIEELVQEKSALEISLKELKSKAEQSEACLMKKLCDAGDVMNSKEQQIKEYHDAYNKQIALSDELKYEVSIKDRDLSTERIISKASKETSKRQVCLLRERFECLRKEREIVNRSLYKITEEANTLRESGNLMQVHCKENARLKSKNGALSQKIYYLEDDLSKAKMEFHAFLKEVDKLQHIVNFEVTRNSEFLQKLENVDKQNRRTKCCLSCLKNMCTELTLKLDLLQKKIVNHKELNDESYDSSIVDELKAKINQLCISANFESAESPEERHSPINSYLKESEESDQQEATSVSMVKQVKTVYEPLEVFSANSKLNAMRNIFQKLNQKLKEALDEKYILETQCKCVKLKKANISLPIERTRGMSKSKSSKRNRAKLESINEVDDANVSPANSEGASPERALSHSAVYDKKIKAAMTQGEIFQNLISQVEDEYFQMKQEVATLQEWSESAELKYVSEITSLHKCLNEAREECSNLGMVLQSLEFEIEERNVSKELIDETGCKIQVSYLKSLLHDMQCREIGLHNLLQKTKTKYESEIANMNYKLDTHVKGLTSQTDHLKNELQTLKDELKVTQENFSAERNNLIQQITTSNCALHFLKKEMESGAYLFNNSLMEFHNKIIHLCEVYDNRISTFYRKTCEKVTMLAQRQKLFHHLRDMNPSEICTHDIAQGFNNMLVELDKDFKHRILLSLKQKAAFKDSDFDLIFEVFLQNSLFDGNLKSVAEFYCSVTSMENVINELKEKVGKYNALCEKYSLTSSDADFLEQYIQKLKGEQTKVLKEEQCPEAAVSNSKTMSEILKLKQCQISKIKMDLLSLKDLYEVSHKGISDDCKELVNVINENSDKANELCPLLIQKEKLIEDLQRYVKELESSKMKLENRCLKLAEENNHLKLSTSNVVKIIELLRTQSNKLSQFKTALMGLKTVHESSCNDMTVSFSELRSIVNESLTRLHDSSVLLIEKENLVENLHCHIKLLETKVEKADEVSKNTIEKHLNKYNELKLFLEEVKSSNLEAENNYLKLSQENKELKVTSSYVFKELHLKKLALSQLKEDLGDIKNLCKHLSSANSVELDEIKTFTVELLVRMMEMSTSSIENKEESVKDLQIRISILETEKANSEKMVKIKSEEHSSLVEEYKNLKASTLGIVDVLKILNPCVYKLRADLANMKELYEDGYNSMHNKFKELKYHVGSIATKILDSGSALIEKEELVKSLQHQIASFETEVKSNAQVLHEKDEEHLNTVKKLEEVESELEKLKCNFSMLSNENQEFCKIVSHSTMVSETLRLKHQKLVQLKDVLVQMSVLCKNSCANMHVEFEELKNISSKSFNKIEEAFIELYKKGSVIESQTNDIVVLQSEVEKAKDRARTLEGELILHKTKQKSLVNELKSYNSELRKKNSELSKENNCLKVKVSNYEKLSGILGVKKLEISALKEGLASLRGFYASESEAIHDICKDLNNVISEDVVKGKELKSALAEKEELIDDLKCSIALLETESQVSKEAAMTKNEENLSMQKKIDFLVVELKLSESKLEEFKSKVEVELAQTNEKFTSTEENYQHQITKLKQEISQLDESCRSLENKHQTLENELRRKHDEQLTSIEEKYQHQMTELNHEISQLEQNCRTLENEYQIKLGTVEDESKQKLDEQSSEFKSKLEEKDTELKQLKSASEKNNVEFSANYSKLHDDIKSKQSTIAQLKNQLSSLEASDRLKMEDFSRKIKQLEHEREQLMIQAQERVAATELKCREDITRLQEKVQDLMLQNKEMTKLKNENSKLNAQLDESLLVAAGNQSTAAKEISLLKEQLRDLQEQLSVKDKDCSEKVEHLEKAIYDLQQANEVLERLKQENEQLGEKVIELEKELSHIEGLKEQMSALQSENESVKAELDSAVSSSKQEKEELNEKIRMLEHSKKDLTQSVKLLRNENDSLRTSENNVSEQILSLKNENKSLVEKLKELKSSDFKCHNCHSGSSDCDSKEIHKECLEKLRVKEVEMENKLKLVIKEFYTQMDVKDFDCDKTFSDLIEQSHTIEEKLQREHKLEIAALSQDIFEKDCALEEMRDHYEELLKEKDTTIKEYEKNLKFLHPSSRTHAELQSSEPSDWDDTWAIPEESLENISPVHGVKADVDKQKEEVETLREELEKCNSELKDLRILLRLTPPQSLHSNNNYDSPLPISEPTEFEYLKNILFEYMMGKETVTLVKVIAAVLKFSEDQTRMVIQREKSKHQVK